MNILQYENYHEKKQHGELDYPYTVYLCTIPQDFNEVPLHWHEEMEIIYIKKGKGVVSVNLTDFQVARGSIIFVLPGQLHAIYTLDPEERMEYENIIFNPGILLANQADSCSKNYLQPLFSGSLLIPVHFAPDHPHYKQIAGILDNCDRIRTEKPFGEILYIKSQLFMLFFVLENQCQLSEPAIENMKSLERMKAVIKYVELHYAEPISVETAAKQASLSMSHFMKCFKETFHCSFVDYLKDYRLTMAARMMVHSEGNVLDVATRAGFNNLSYFTRCFKKKYGVTPGKYGVRVQR